MIIIPYKQEPVLFDRIIQQLQDGFKAKLKWLNYAFGRSYKIEKPVDNSTSYNYRNTYNTDKYPGVYIGDGEYMSVLPDDTLGNFLFFELNDPIVVNKLQSNRLSAKGAIIFWLKLDTIYEDTLNIYSDEIKLEVLRCLNDMRLTAGSINVLSVYEGHENIYAGYDTSQIDGQYLMFPYYGFKINVEFNISELCLQ